MAVIKKDIAIIGAGPVGLFTVFEAGMLGLSTVVIDTLDFPGGQCSALYPEKPIYDIPGFVSISGQDLIDNLLAQAKPFDPKFVLSSQVTECKHNDSYLTLKTDKGQEIECKCLIIAAGCGAFGPNKPPLENLAEYEKESVQYYVRSKSTFRNKHVVIGGGGDSAVDWAVELATIAKSVKIIHRRDKFRAAPGTVEQMKKLSEQGKIEILTPYQLKSLHGENGKLEAVEIYDFDKNTKLLKADYLLPFYGLSMKLGPIANWGLNLEKNHIHVMQGTSETNTARIFAIGDICHYSRKLKLILTGFAEAANACYRAYEYIKPEQPLHFEYSTTKGVPK